MLDPDEYHRIAQDCRDRAAQDPAAANKFLDAAVMWEQLALQIAIHIRTKPACQRSR
jgi:hypothetical protein